MENYRKKVEKEVYGKAQMEGEAVGRKAEKTVDSPGFENAKNFVKFEKIKRMTNQ